MAQLGIRQIANRRQIQVLLGPSGVVLSFLLLLSLTWRRWCDLLIDFGRELYVAWQVSEGAALFHDVAYFNGPLSPLINGSIFAVWGGSMTTLICANVALLALFTGGLYYTLARLFRPWVATAVSILFLVVFGFGHYRTVGNYNFIQPYSHECTHGVYAAFAMMWLLTLPRQLKPWPILLAGVAWGLTFLGKPEIFLAASCAAGGVFVIQLREAFQSPGHRRPLLWHTALFIGGGLFVVAAMWLYLASWLSWSQALVNVTGGWRWVFTTNVSNQQFYQIVTGFDDPAGNLWEMVKQTIALAMMVGCAVFLDRWWVRRESLYVALGVACGLVALMCTNADLPWLLRERSILLVGFGLFLFYGYRMLRVPHTEGSSNSLHKEAACWVWSIFGLAMLAKIILAPRFFHYGFVLAMPITVLMAATGLMYLPRMCHRWGGGRACQILLVGIFCMDVGCFVDISAKYMALKRVVVRANSTDWLYYYGKNVSDHSEVTQQLVDYIQDQLPEDATLACLPEGNMVNFMTRRSNSTRYTNLMPPEMAMYGEAAIVNAFRQAPPDYVCLIHKETDEYGVRFFGSEQYGEHLLNWIRNHYQLEKQLGAEPFRSKDFGIQVLKRRDPPLAKESWAWTP